MRRKPTKLLQPHSWQPALPPDCQIVCGGSIERLLALPFSVLFFLILFLKRRGRGHNYRSKNYKHHLPKKCRKASAKATSTKSPQHPEKIAEFRDPISVEPPQILPNLATIASRIYQVFPLSMWPLGFGWFWCVSPPPSQVRKHWRSF